MWTRPATLSLCLIGASLLTPAAYGQPWAGHRGVITPLGDPYRQIHGGTQIYGPYGVQSYNPFPPGSPMGVRYINGRRVDPLQEMMNSPAPAYRPVEREERRLDVASMPSPVHVPHVHVPHINIPHVQIAHKPVEIPKTSSLSSSSWSGKGIVAAIAASLAALGSAIVRMLGSLGISKRES